MVVQTLLKYAVVTLLRVLWGDYALCATVSPPRSLTHTNLVS